MRNPFYKSFLLLAGLWALGAISMAQPVLQSYTDGVYRDYIRSVRLHVTGLALTYPIAALGSENALYLSFDELDGQGTRYYYTVIHCDRHWQPTQELDQFDYLPGYREGEIRDYEFSTGTYQHYVHYKLSLPNEEVSWTLSGNYLLVVYEAGEENDPILTRRFMITEEKIKMEAEVVRPTSVDRQTTAQEIDFQLETSALKIYNPRVEVFCTLLQNGRWDNSIQDIEPRLVTGTVLDYNYSNQIVFDAGKEFRNMNISSMEFRSEDVQDIKETREGLTTILRDDKTRVFQSYLWARDLNGMYVPFNRDYNHKNIPPDSLVSTLNLVNRYNYREQFLGTEYSKVIVILESSELDRDVYFVGGITDWKLLPEYKLTYDETIQAYTGELYLKQGYYNYGYAVPDKNGNPDLSKLEGDWYATENDYTLLCYFRPRGGQYDQLVGAHTFNSNE